MRSRKMFWRTPWGRKMVKKDNKNLLNMAFGDNYADLGMRLLSSIHNSLHQLIFLNSWLPKLILLVVTILQGKEIMWLQEQSMTLMVKGKMNYLSVLATFCDLLPRANSHVSEDGFLVQLMALLKALFLLIMSRLSRPLHFIIIWIILSLDPV